MNAAQVFGIALLALAAFITIALVPMLKYPANPPAVGNPDTIGPRTGLYLSMLVNPRFPGAQYAFLSGFAFLLPRLVAGASGAIQQQIGYDGFFLMSGALSLGAIVFLPLIAGVRPRREEA